MPQLRSSRTTGRRSRPLAACVGWMLLLAGVQAWAGTPSPLRCQAAKENAAGKYAKCIAIVRSKEVKTGATRDASRCVARLEKAFAKAETVAAGTCPTLGDATAVIAKINGCTDDTTTGILNGIAPPGTGGDTAKCDARKTKAPGRYLGCLMRARAKATKWGVFVDPTDTGKCEDKLLDAIDRSNAGDATSPCSVVGDGPAILASANACSLDFSGASAQTGIFGMTCDLGIAVIQIPMSLTVTPEDVLAPGVPQQFETQLTVEINESLVGALLSLGATLIQLDSADSLTTVTGASGGPAANAVEGTPFLLDLTVDTDVPPNGTPGPVVIESNVATTPLTPLASGTPVEFDLDTVSVELSSVPVLGTLSLACIQDPGAGNEPISFVVP